MQEILAAILAGDTAPTEFGALPVPDDYRAVTVHKDEIAMFEGRPPDSASPASAPVSPAASPR